MTLNSNDVKNAKPASANCKLTDANGLALQVSPFGIKTWHDRYRHKGREKVLTLGHTPKLGSLQLGSPATTQSVSSTQA